MGEMLSIKDEYGKERVVYFIRKTLVNYETRYVPIEKLCYVIILIAKKLIHYISGSTNSVVTMTNPLNYLLSKPYLLGREEKWVMLLQEFILVFINQKSVKVQILADFMVDFPCDDSSPLNE